MFLVTSVTTLRERSSGTLERLLAMPTGKLDLPRSATRSRSGRWPRCSRRSRSLLSVGLLGLDVAGPVWVLVVVAVADAVLGTALGLFVSAFARTEFQAVQFMPAIVIPQILLCGLFVPARPAAAGARGGPDVLPLSYAVDAMTSVATSAAPARRRRLGGVGRPRAWSPGSRSRSLGLGAATLRRRTA